MVLRQEGDSRKPRVDQDNITHCIDGHPDLQGIAAAADGLWFKAKKNATCGGVIDDSAITQHTPKKTSPLHFLELYPNTGPELCAWSQRPADYVALLRVDDNATTFPYPTLFQRVANTCKASATGWIGFFASASAIEDFTDAQRSQRQATLWSALDACTSS